MGPGEVQRAQSEDPIQDDAEKEVVGPRSN